MKRMISVFTVLAILATTFSGCVSNTVNRAMDLVIATANRACSELPNLESDKAVEFITNSLASGGKVSLIRLDGAPALVSEATAKVKGVNSAAAKRNVDKSYNRILTSLKKLDAVTEECDPLGALSLAARHLESSRAATKVVFIADSLISTFGYFNMANSNIINENTDCDAIVEILSEKHYIPDLSKIDKVCIQGMSDVSSPQCDLTPTLKEKMEELWKKIIEKGGSTFDKSFAASKGESISCNYPHVTPMAVKEDTPLTGNIFSEPLFLSESQIAFKPDSAIILSKKKALETLKPVAEYMESHQNFRLLIAGCCAGDLNSEYGQRLSELRAEIIRDMLGDMCIDKDRVETIGLGSGPNNPFHISAVDLTSELAEQNRVVVLLDASTRSQYGI